MSPQKWPPNMSKNITYELLIDGELIDPLLAMWSARLDKIDRWGRRANRTAPLYDQLLTVFKAANQAHSDLTGLNIYRKRNPEESTKVQQQLRTATVSHRRATELYTQLLSDMCD